MGHSVAAAAAALEERGWLLLVLAEVLALLEPLAASFLQI
jgi:hypothetical protein